MPEYDQPMCKLVDVIGIFWNSILFMILSGVVYVGEVFLDKFGGGTVGERRTPVEKMDEISELDMVFDGDEMFRNEFCRFVEEYDDRMD